MLTEFVLDVFVLHSREKRDFSSNHLLRGLVSYILPFIYAVFLGSCGVSNRGTYRRKSWTHIVIVTVIELTLYCLPYLALLPYGFRSVRRQTEYTYARIEI